MEDDDDVAAAAPEGRSRPRRTANRAEKTKALLENLAAVKAGGKRRLDTFELKEEGRIYDKVDEYEYAEIVSKRRQKGQFVTDDDGAGYADIGEEEDWEVDNGPAESDGSPKGGRAAKGAAAANDDDDDDEPHAAVPGPRGPIGVTSNARWDAAQARKTPGVARAGGGDGRQRLAAMFAAAAVGPARPGTLPTSDTPDDFAAAMLRSIDDESPAATRPATTRAPAAAAAPYRPPMRVAYGGAADYLAPVAVSASAALHRTGHRATHPTPAVVDDGGLRGDDAVALPDDHTSPTPAPAAAVPRPRPAIGVEGMGGMGGMGMGAILESVTPGSAAPLAGWATACEALDACDAQGAPASSPPQGAHLRGGEGAAGGFPVDATGVFPFFFLDAFEDAAAPGTVFLFGKAAAPVEEGTPTPPQAKTEFVSLCIAVRNISRAVFFIPAPSVFFDADGTLARLESTAASAKAAAAVPAAAESIVAAWRSARAALMRELHARSTAPKTEARAALVGLGIETLTLKIVKRSYAFERPGIPHGEQWVLKVTYPCSRPGLPTDWSSQHVVGVLNAQGTALESLLLKRKIKGPAWLGVRRPSPVTPAQRVSWCRLEADADGHKAISVLPGSHPLVAGPPPPLIALAINLKTVVSPKSNVHEIAAACLVTCRGVRQDGPMDRSEWMPQLRRLSIVRPLEGAAYPPGWQAEVASANAGRAGQVLSSQGSERALLSFLLAKLADIDPDVIVGHNVLGFDLDVLLHRLSAHKLVAAWSKVGRLKRAKLPYLGGGGGGGAAERAAAAALAGRLVCDTWLSAREFWRESEYSLAALSAKHLGETRLAMTAADIPPQYNTASGLRQVLAAGETDAWLALGLMFHLSALPLTRQLTCLTGYLWSRTLLGARAQRIEWLLLHEFHGRKYCVPDKLTWKEKSRLARSAAEAAGDDDDGADDSGAKKGGRRREKPSYAGGLVLEPKVGLHDKLVLLLDFNSLYPSIIQEYNICFTTVARPRGPARSPATAPGDECDDEDGGAAAAEAAAWVPCLPDRAGDAMAVLPSVLRTLVERRRAVKQELARERDGPRRRQLDIRQLALKLTANSMYGCLGFKDSRFFAKPLAQLVTAQGREILQSSVELVQGSLGLEVIYGDTDSIMINSNTTDADAARRLGGDVKRAINKRYRLLEIELDGLFQCMLLLKKKKYAAVKLEPGPDGSLVPTLELKGLDIVRRDWCGLAKEAGHAALQDILSGRPRDDVVSAILARLSDLRTRVESGTVPLGKFVITKALTRRPEDYGDPKKEPHVQVALRMRAAGKREGVSSGETVPYVICVEAAPAGEGGGDKAAGKAFADRAYHPEEVAAAAGALRVDAEYYLANQVHAVVARLCAPIEGTGPQHLAEALGLDASKYRAAIAAAAAAAAEAADADAGGAGGLDDADSYRRCLPLELSHPQTPGTSFAFAGAAAIAAGAVTAAEALTPPSLRPDGGQGGGVGIGDVAAGNAAPAKAGGVSGVMDSAIAALTPAQFANAVRRCVAAVVSAYYDGGAACEDDACRVTCRDAVCRLGGGVSTESGPEWGAAHPLGAHRCGGAMRRAWTERALFFQLQHFRRLLDGKRALDRLPPSQQDAAAHRLLPLLPALQAGLAEVDSIQARCGYNWIDLGALFAGAGGKARGVGGA